MRASRVPRRWSEPRHRSILAWCAFALVLALAVELALFSWLNRGVYRSGDLTGFLILAAVGPAWAAIGALIVSRKGNLVGWILAAVGATMVAAPASEEYVLYGLVTAPGSLPATAIAARVGSLSFVLLWGIGLLFLLFPTGRPLTDRWRPIIWALVAGAVLHTVGWIIRVDDSGRAVISGPRSDHGVFVQNRLAVPALSWVWQVGVAIGLLATGAGIVSLVIRFRRSHGEERAQTRWLAFVGALVAVFFFVGLLPGLRDSDLTFLWLFATLVVGIPAACAIAILKYRLYDIDVVIRKTVVFGLLAAFITVVYAAIVSLASMRFRDSQVGSFVAAATLAMMFAPARDRARKIADRLVYGRRATPYEVLAEFSDRVGGAYAADDVLTRMAQVLEEGTGAVGARVLLQVGTEQREAAAIGERSPGETVVPVSHQGEELGALAASMPASDPMNPAKLHLVEDLAAQAGLVLRNVKLIEELKASRQRLVAAQDEERRKIERNIHDGAQQQLIAVAVQLKLAESMVGKNPDKERELLARLAVQSSEALEDLRDLARGIYPPLLLDKGLPATLEAHARKVAVPVSVETDGIGRYDLAVESAVYFCTLEALNNVAKYAEASSAHVALAQRDGHLTFSVTDDGRGFDPDVTSYGTGLQGMADRLAAIGGELSVTSTPGAGTTITGTVPA